VNGSRAKISLLSGTVAFACTVRNVATLDVLWEKDSDPWVMIKEFHSAKVSQNKKQ
jgi:hypothetical protein